MGYRDKNDARYYVPLIIYPAYCDFPARFNFLIDTGASRTQLSWKDADYFGIVIRSLPSDVNTIGLGGTVRG